MASAALLGAAAFLFACCSQDELPGAGGANARPDGIAALHIASATLQVPQAQPGTRATSAATRATAAPLTTGSIGVFRSKGTGYAEALANKQYTYTAANGWQPSAAADTVYLMANDADVCAYFPYNSAYTDVAAIPLASGKYTGTADDLAKHDTLDICYDVNRTLNGALTATDFTMKHAMAMVQLSFERLNYDSDNCNLTSVTIKNKELISTATLDITDGTYGTGTKATNAALTWTPGATDPATGIQVPATGVSAPTSALLVPCTLDAGGTTFGFTVDGQKMSVKVPAATLSALTAGKIYKLKFIIHAASVTLSDVSIIDWTSAWSAGSEPNIDGTPKDYIELGGVKWAISNLEYSPANATYGFSLSSATPGTPMAWNALTDTDSGNNTDAWDPDTDPCVRLEPKGTWTMPTKEDFAALIALPKVWTDNYNGAKGQWFGTSNAAEAALSPDRYLFLTAGNAGAATVGYWTQTYGTKNNPHSLWIMKTSAPIEEDLVAYSTPLNVRCVKVKVEVPKEPIDLGLDFLIAPGNLIATSNDGGTTYKYSFAADQGYYGGEGSYNEYFCWNTLVPTGDIVQTNWDLDRDPCSQVGIGWVTPSEDDFIALESKSYVVDADYVSKAMGKTVKGMYFGTSSPTIEQAEQDRYVFLPFAGTRMEDTWRSIGSTGRYWSSTPYGNFACSISFGSSTYIYERFSSRYEGFSVRCVKHK